MMVNLALLPQTPWALFVPAVLIVAFLIYGWFENANRTPESDGKSRLPLYNKTMAMLWVLAVACVGGWLLAGNSLAELGFRPAEDGWRGWLAWGFAGLGLAYLLYCSITLALSRTARGQLRSQLDSADLAFMRPRTGAEHARFRWLSVTAGITEEIAFRGFLIALLALAMPLPAAALVAVVLFGLGHIYQGWGGVIRTGLVGGVMAIVYLVGGSLWPVIVLHILIDLAAGAQFQLADAFEEADGEVDMGSAETA